jgi:hypothetical protein
LKKYRRLQALLLAILVGTFALGLVSAVRPAGEIFPFASWFLFSLVPQRVTSYDVLVSSWGDRKFTPPKPLIEVDGLISNPGSSTVYQLVQRFGQATEAGNRAAADEAWRLLRAKFSSAEPVTFDVIKRTYDPIDRSKGQIAEAIRIIPRPSARETTNGRAEDDR